MPVHCLPGDEQAHDLAGTFEDQIDPGVPQDALHRNGGLAPGLQRVGFLVAPAAPHLHRLIGDLPGCFRVPHLRHRGLEADVRASSIRHLRAELRHGVQGEDIGGHVGQDLSDGLMLAYRLAPLNPLTRPVAANLEADLGHPRHRGGERQASRVESDQGQLQPATFRPQEILPGDAHLVETDDGVFDRVEPHEVAAVRHPDARPGGFHDERRDLPGIRMTRHDHQQLRHGPIGAPELLTVQDIGASVLGPDGCGGEVGGIRAHVRLGEREGGDRPGGAAGQVPLLLLGRPEQLHRLRHPDGLVGGEQRGEVGVVAGHEHGGAGIIGLREAESAVGR